MEELVQGLRSVLGNLEAMRNELDQWETRIKEDPSVLEARHCRDAQRILRDIREVLSNLDAEVSGITANLYDEQVP